jgi:subtilisin family serine protease
MSDTETVHLLAADEGHNHLADIYDARTNRFRRFEALPPLGGMTGKGVVLAVIDTGLLSKHPVIRARMIEAVDFTGEGAEDENGHGTKVALVLLRQSPDASLISVKALKKDGTSSAKDLLKALRWVREDKRIRVVNLSAGVYRPDCAGHCSVCEAARRVVAAGKVVLVAAGNLPGITACPAKASDAVMTVAAFDSASGAIASYSSPATTEGILAPVDPVPAEWVDQEGNPVGN